MKGPAKILFLIALVLLAPGRLPACATCYGAVDSAMTEGMNFGIMTLLAFIGTVLMCALGLLIYFIRKSEALNAAAEQSAKSSKV